MNDIERTDRILSRLSDAQLCHALGDVLKTNPKVASHFEVFTRVWETDLAFSLMYTDSNLSYAEDATDKEGEDLEGDFWILNELDPQDFAFGFLYENGGDVLASEISKRFRKIKSQWASSQFVGELLVEASLLNTLLASFIIEHSSQDFRSPTSIILMAPISASLMQHSEKLFGISFSDLHCETPDTT